MRLRFWMTSALALASACAGELESEAGRDGSLKDAPPLLATEGKPTGRDEGSPESGNPAPNGPEGGEDAFGGEPNAMSAGNIPVGEGGDDGTQGPAVLDSCDATSLSVPVRRLTNGEYQAAVQELFGANAVAFASLLPPSAGGYVYSTSSDALLVGEQQVQAYSDAAETIALDALDALPACGAESEECARRTIDEWSDVLYRGQGSSADSEALVALAQAGIDAGLIEQEALALVLSAMLQDPRFLYVVESRDEPGSFTLPAPAKAQRLALTLFGTPNAEFNPTLLEEAPDQTIAAALDDPSLGLQFESFIREWLALEGIPSTHTADLHAALDEELSLLIAESFSAADGLSQLLTTDSVYADSVLEAFYGLSPQSEGPGDFRNRSGDYPRTGILTHPLVLAASSHGEISSPILRGKWVRFRLLCNALPPPPANALSQEPVLPADADALERYVARAENPSCGGCHALLDPIGFALEAFDGLGRYRGEEALAPVAGAAEILSGGDASGAFENATELGAALAASQDVQRCFTRQWVEWSLGHAPSGASACLAEDVNRAFSDSARSFPTLFEALVNHPSFFQRGVPSP